PPPPPPVFPKTRASARWVFELSSDVGSSELPVTVLVVAAAPVATRVVALKIGRASWRENGFTCGAGVLEAGDGVAAGGGG
ncbi:hypothetical protein PJH59_29485, partial [Mycobacterium kansasii]